MKKTAKITSKILAALLITALVFGSNVAKAADDGNTNAEQAVIDVLGNPNSATPGAIELVSGENEPAQPEQPAPVADEKPAEQPAAPADGQPEQPAEEQPAEEQPAAGQAEEPTYPAADYYFTFSIAKAKTITDGSTKTTFDGKNYKDYFQVKKVSKNVKNLEDGIANGEKIELTDGRTYTCGEMYVNPYTRFVIYINTAQVQELMGKAQDVTTAECLNETAGNEIPFSYKAERSEGIHSEQVEDVLSTLGLKATVDSKVFKYMTESNEVKDFLQANYPDFSFANSDDWCIDWYVMKTQNNGIHVDGVIVTKYDTEPEQVTWDVFYDFLDKDNNEKDPYEFGFREAFTVNEGETPDFTDSNILSPSNASDGVYADADFELVTIDGKKFIVNESDHCIIITYQEKAKNEEHNEDPKDPEKKEEKEIPNIPFFEEEKEDDPTPVQEPQEEPEEVTVPVETPEVPEGAVDEPEIIVPAPEVPAGAVEEEEVIPVDLPEIPAGGDVLPQTGLPDPALFFEFGAAFIGVGAVVVRKGLRKKEED